MGNINTKCFRSFPAVYGRSYIDSEDLWQFLLNLSVELGKVRLVPMHTFAVGGDDRRYFAELLYSAKPCKIAACHDPMNLNELYKCYTKSILCIGMRYHSVVMQTVLNRNNYVFNYTDPNEGKIVGFIGDVWGFMMAERCNFKNPAQNKIYTLY